MSFIGFSQIEGWGFFGEDEFWFYWIAIYRETRLSREQLYRSFSEKGNPTLAVMKALGIELTAKVQRAA